MKGEIEVKCYFCGYNGVTDIIEKWEGQKAPEYHCNRCGKVRLEEDTADYSFEEAGFTEKQKKIISISLRNEFERRGGRPPKDLLDTRSLNKIIETYREMDAIEKMDNALLILDRKNNRIGDVFKISYENDYPLYHCFSPAELIRIIEFLHTNGFIKGEGTQFNVQGKMYIDAKGYERLRELKRTGSDSRQCFVAMWFTDEMDDVYRKTIKCAIEYVEEGQRESKFKALNIGKKEHTNDINDEIISEIRRSRFMVCDLTGYRGGVYWEAGFAYGLGLEVIYTCREDWIKTKELDLYDQDGNKVEYKQEGIHFDLEHRNRIEWKDDTPEDLEDFKDKLTKRIKAVIV